MKCSSFTTGLNELGTPRYKEFQIDETGIQFFWANIYFVDRFLIKSEMSFQGYLRTYIPTYCYTLNGRVSEVGGQDFNKTKFKQNQNMWSVAVAQLAERWLPIPEVPV